MSGSIQLIWSLHGPLYTGNGPHPGFYHIWDLVFTCMQKNLHIHIAVFIINVSILLCDYCVLYAEAPVMFIFSSTAIFKRKENEPPVAECGLSTSKCQHHVAPLYVLGNQSPITSSSQTKIGQHLMLSPIQTSNNI